MPRLDPETGELVEGEPECEGCAQARAQVVEAELLLRGAERELTKQIKANNALRMEMRKRLEDTPDGKAAKALGRYWITRLGKGSNTKVKDKRLEAIIKRLRDGYEPSYIARAIDGAAEAAGTSRPETERLALIAALGEAKRHLTPEQLGAVKNTYREGMKNLKRYDDLELICRDEVKLEDFHDRAERVNAPTLVGPAWLSEFEGVKFEPKPEDTPF